MLKQFKTNIQKLYAFPQRHAFGAPMTLALRPRWRPRLPFRPLAASALRLGIRGEAAGEAARAREREAGKRGAKR